MAEETLEANANDRGVVGAVQEQPSGEKFTKDDVLAMIETAKAEAIRSAEEAAFRRAQSKIDQDVARITTDTRSQLDTLMARTAQVLAEHGAEPEAIEGLQRQTRTELEMQELREKARAYDVLKAEQEAERGKEEYIRRVCAKYNIDRYDKRLKEDSPETLMESVLEIQQGRLERRDKDAQRDQQKQDLDTLRQAGALDVTGGGAAMAPPAWSTAKLVAGSEESIIAGHLIHYFGKLKPEELGQKIAKVQQVMKQEPRLAGKLKDAARRVYEQEAGR